MKANKRYSGVIEMMEGEKMPRSIINRVKKLIKEDEKNLTLVKRDGKEGW